jgi:uncharacterized protein YegL
MNAFTTPSNEPPPAYSPAEPGAVIGGSPTASTSGVQASNSQAGPSSPINVQPSVPQVRAPLPADDRYAFLSSFDTVFLIDDSGSMAGRSWRETRQALETITPICTAHDADGIDIYFLNADDSPSYQNVRSANEVDEIFKSVRPMGGTPTGQRLNKILKRYMTQFTHDQENTKPLNIIVITDGEPSDDVESPIISTAKKLDKLDAPAWQIGIQFFQVGNEPGAKEHLKQLDDGLAELSGEDDLRDMVDTVPFSGAEGTELTGEGILKVRTS